MRSGLMGLLRPMVASGSVSPFDLNLAENLILTDHELIQLHQFQQCEECHNNFGLGGCRSEQGFKGHALPRAEIAQEHLDFV